MRCSGRYFVEASARKGMAAQQPENRQGSAFHGTVGDDCDFGIFRARGQVFAAAGTEGMQRGRKPAAIEGESGEQNARHKLPRVKGSGPC